MRVRRHFYYYISACRFAISPRRAAPVDALRLRHFNDEPTLMMLPTMSSRCR